LQLRTKVTKQISDVTLNSVDFSLPITWPYDYKINAKKDYRLPNVHVMFVGQNVSKFVVI